MSLEFLEDTWGKRIVNVFSPLIWEARRTFKDYSYDELKSVYNLSKKEIQKHMIKYILSIKATDLTIEVAMVYF